MNRKEFMERLEQLLWSLSPDERSDALKYYNDYFDDAGPEREQDVIRELISPEAVAKSILDGVNQARYGDTSGRYSGADYDWNTQTDASWNRTGEPKRSKFKMPVWGWVLLIVTLPITAPLVFGILSTLIGLFAGAFFTMIGFFFGGIGLVIGGAVLIWSGMYGIAGLCLGLGFIMECIVFLLIPFFVWIVRGAIPGVFRFIRGIITGRGGNAV